MAMIKCRGCGHNTSKQAKTCPQCGHPNKKPASKPAGCLMLIILVLLIWLVAQQGGEVPGRSAPAPTQAAGAGQAGKDGEPDPVGSAYVVCEAMKNTGLTTRCDVRGWGKTVDVRMDTSSGQAREICGGVASQTRSGELTALATKGWKLRIFSPYSGDEPIAVCNF